MTAMLGNGRRKVKHKNDGLPSLFIHPSNLGGNCKTTLVSSHRKRSLLFLYFPVRNSVCQLFARFISRIPFLYYTAHFLASFCQKFPNRMCIQWTDWATAVCSRSWCSRQRHPSVPCARARNDRNWREKRSTRSSLPAVMSTVVEQALVLSEAPYYWEWATVDKVLKGFARSYQFSLYVQICLHLWQILYTLFPIRGTQRILASHKQESLQYLWRKKVSCCEFDNCLFLVLFHHFQNHSLPAVIVKRSKI